MPTPRALLFDLDGVLVDTEPLHARAKLLAFERHGIRVPAAFFDEFTGRSDRDVAAQAVARHGDGRATAEQVLSAKHALFADLRSEMTAVPGALAFVRAARRRFAKLALTTSATRENQRFACERFGLTPFFDAVVTAEDIVRTKPDPEPYLTTAAGLALPAADCLVIEDSVNGVLSGKAAGCRVAAITTSFPAQALVGAGADWVGDGFAALAAALGLALTPA